MLVRHKIRTNIFSQTPLEQTISSERTTFIIGEMDGCFVHIWALSWQKYTACIIQPRNHLAVSQDIKYPVNTVETSPPEMIATLLSGHSSWS